MSLLVELDAEGAAHVRGEAPSRPAPAPAKPANDGHGDVRKKIVPVVKPPAGPSASEWEGGSYLSMQEWLDGAEQGGAILLQPADDVRALDGRIDSAALISVDFHRIGDGRGYTHAFLLRKRLNYAGKLRALGAVTADQMHAMARVGFDSFALRADQDAESAVAALSTFSVPYQGGAVAGSSGARAEAAFRARVRLLERALIEIAQRHDRPALASSLSAEDMVITDVIARLKLPIDVFTLDTGRLHPETVALIGETERRYDLNIAVHRPDEAAVAAYIAAHGRDGFYDGVSQRKLCCNIRKVAPLARALAGRDAWVTGQRREQAVTRGALAESERDAERDMQKYNPLAAWSWADVLEYAERFNIPMSALYARGYVSIGCEPCTKAIRPGEDPRAGRWWWENQDTKECGLHTTSTAIR
jgi:phosphoadenosine phosphosulfate reductase